MATLIFVHGTGVREKSYRETLKIVRAKLGERNSRRTPKAAIRLAECSWGDKFGVNLTLKGDSIPDFQRTHGMQVLPNSTSQEDLDLVLWAALGRDSLYELRELAKLDRERGGFGKGRLGAALLDRFGTFEASPAVIQALKSSDLFACYSDALEYLRVD